MQVTQETEIDETSKKQKGMIEFFKTEKFLKLK
jgi:hypothetical protein